MAGWQVLGTQHLNKSNRASRCNYKYHRRGILRSRDMNYSCVYIISGCVKVAGLGCWGFGVGPDATSHPQAQAAETLCQGTHSRLLPTAHPDSARITL